MAKEIRKAEAVEVEKKRLAELQWKIQVVYNKIQYDRNADKESLQKELYGLELKLTDYEKNKF